MEKNNKLIAEFMGMKNMNPNNDTIYQLMVAKKGSGLPHELPIGNEIIPTKSLEYHKSWDWLMPVVKKIGDEYYNTPFDETYSKLTEQYENIWTLEDTYNAVVEFIKDQNTIKNN